MPIDANGDRYVTMVMHSVPMTARKVLGDRARPLGKVVRDEILRPRSTPAPTPRVSVTPEGAYVDGELAVERSSSMSWAEAGAEPPPRPACTTLGPQPHLRSCRATVVQKLCDGGIGIQLDPGARRRVRCQEALGIPIGHRSRGDPELLRNVTSAPKHLCHLLSPPPHAVCV